MRAIAAIAVLLVAACSQPLAQTPSPSAQSPSPSASAQASSPTASAAVPFNCRLPVLWFNQDPTVDGKTGFVTFPAATLSAPTGSPPRPVQFTYSTSYDRTVERWLPVSPEAVAPDGLHYAYADYDQPAPNDIKAGVTTGRVHIVDARSGDDRIVYSGSPTFAVVDYTAAGLYLARLSTAQYAAQRRGLYLMDPSDGIPHLVPGSDVQLDFGGWRALDGDAAWGTRYSDVGGVASGNELFRFDIKTGETVSWMTAPTTHSVYILGFDNGNPLASSSLSGFTTGQSLETTVMLMTGPGQARQIYSTDSEGPASLGVADAHGLWMGGGGAVWLYQPASGIRPIPVLADPNTAVEVGGACV